MKEEFRRLVNKMCDCKILNQEQLALLLKLLDKENWENQEWDWLMDTYYKELDETLVNAVLEAAQLAIIYDAESGQVPPPYEKTMIPLLLEFVGLDNLQTEINLNYTRIETGSDNYFLSINYANNKYDIKLNDIGDYYDVDGMLTILNDIIIAQGKTFIVHEISTNDQSFCFYKGNLISLNTFLTSYDTKS